MLNKPKNIKVAVGMSGGVDSSVAAALLLEQGYDVFGVFIQFWAETIDGKVRDNICCSLEAQEDARRVCQQLGIPFYTMNLRVPFKENVVDYFIAEYSAGRTPNPCVLCNKQIKFGEFWRKAKALGADFIATGHYARVIYLRPAGFHLRPGFGGQVGRQVKLSSYPPTLCGASADRSSYLPTPHELRQTGQVPTTTTLQLSKDTEKDQTYFLHQLNQEQLSHVLFPIGGYEKAEVRELARKFGLVTAGKRESQEVCFIPNGSLGDFLKKYLPLEKGEIRDLGTGSVIGEHNGLALYTIGQRKGIGLGGGPWYVVQLDVQRNVLWVSKNEADLGKMELVLKGVNWISGAEPELPLKAKCKVRYASEFVDCTITNNQGKIKVLFDNPIRAITAGQFCVFWKGKECLGGGEITS